MITQIGGSTNSSGSLPLMTLPGLSTGTFTLPTISIPSFTIPPINPFIPSAGTNTATTSITVIDGGGPTTYTGIDTLEFTSAFTLTPVGTNQITIDYLGGGGGGGTTLKYGKITNAVQTAGYAFWTYTVDIYTAGAVSSTVTAYNMLEFSNTATLAYGYAVTGGDRITGTSYYIRSVPLNTWIRMESNGDIPALTNYPGGTNYIFHAPNVISGTC
jgi:hypothetical protein